MSTTELKTDTVGRVYAEALLELAREQGQVDALADEVQQLLPVIAEGGELNRLLTNPAIGDAERAKIVERVFGGKISDTLYKFFLVLSGKGRLGSLPQVAAGYLLAVSEERGQIDVQAYIASELDSAAAQQVADQIGKALGKQVTLTQKVDASLIGGLKIKVGDQLIDASVASQLRSMKNKMIAAGRS
ncbi:MAG: ATP synthase F1 subunit delta [Planctomycetota bacterium]